MKKVNISEDRLKKALREVFKEEVLNGENPDNQHPLGREGGELEMGVGDDGSMRHDVGIVDTPEDLTNYGPDEGLNDYRVKG